MLREKPSPESSRQAHADHQQRQRADLAAPAGLGIRAADEPVFAGLAGRDVALVDAAPDGAGRDGVGIRDLLDRHHTEHVNLGANVRPDLFCITIWPAPSPRRGASGRTPRRPNRNRFRVD